jgi:hypothetical protein
MSEFHPNGQKFHSEGSSGDPRILKATGTGEADRRDVNMRHENVNCDGVARDRVRVIQSFYQSLPKAPRLLT